MNKFIPSEKGKKGRICICQLICDEHDYIEEWVEFHYNLGISHFYLIEDFCSKSHKDVLEKYPFVELYKIEEIINDQEHAMLIAKKYRQRIVWNIFHRLWYDLYDYMAFIDVDEYIDLNRQELEELLKKGDNYPIIDLQWKNMTANGHIQHPNNRKKYSIVKTYKNYNFITSNKKMIINCDKNFYNMLSEESMSHIPHDAIGIKHLDNAAYLRHYLCKSFEEFINRLINRGEICTANHNRKIEDWIINNPDMKNRKEELIKLIPENPIIKCNDYPSPYKYQVIPFSITSGQFSDLIIELERYKPKNIIELGSGESTKVFKTYCEIHKGQLVSIDCTKEKDNNVIILPVHENTDIEIGGRIYGSCNKFVGFENWLKNQQKFDFIFIDAPFGYGFRMNYTYSRVQLLSFIILDKIADNSIVIFHDSERINAKKTLDEFECLLGEKGYVYTKSIKCPWNKQQELTIYHIRKL